MLNEICEHLHNYFDMRDGEFIDYTYGDFTISDGSISPLPTSLKGGQYIRIVGSILNDGIYLLPADLIIEELEDETFTGSIFGLAIPRDLVALDAKITAYVDENPASAYTSESFGGWSGTRATDAGGAPISWEKAFAKRLNRWRVR